MWRQWASMVMLVKFIKAIHTLISRKRFRQLERKFYICEQKRKSQFNISHMVSRLFIKDTRDLIEIIYDWDCYDLNMSPTFKEYFWMYTL